MNQKSGAARRPSGQASPKSKATIWPSSMPTRACSDARPPKPTCSGISASARPPSTRWSLRLERAGLIRRQPGVARSIELLVALEDLPILEWLKNQPVKTSVQMNDFETGVSGFELRSRGIATES